MFVLSSLSLGFPLPSFSFLSFHHLFVPAQFSSYSSRSPMLGSTSCMGWCFVQCCCFQVTTSTSTAASFLKLNVVVVDFVFVCSLWLRDKQHTEKSWISKQLSKQHGLYLFGSYSSRHNNQRFL